MLDAEFKRKGYCSEVFGLVNDVYDELCDHYNSTQILTDSPKFKTLICDFGKEPEFVLLLAKYLRRRAK